jgi:NAD(P)-dependent dehydrogenase (short-subunit alcohol dehydrogenase family)
MKLKDKVALITGGTTGIGAATARLFQSEGATVIVTGSSPATAEAAKSSLPGIEVLAADQADTQASKALVEHVKDRYGRIDVLFVNAGVGKFAPLQAADEAHFDLMFNINVRGLYFVIKHAAPVIADGGAILLTGSVAGARGRAGMSVYSATKAAMRSFARTLAAEFAPRNIRVNIISPGPAARSFSGAGSSTSDVLEFNDALARRGRAPIWRGPAPSARDDHAPKPLLLRGGIDRKGPMALGRPGDHTGGVQRALQER